MKRIITMAALAASLLTAQAQNDPYKAKMDSLNAASSALYQEYKTLSKAEAENKTEKGQNRIKEILATSESIDEQQVELIMQVVKENHDNQIPADYLADAFYGLNYKQLKTALDPTAAYYNNAKLEKARKYFEGLQKRAPGKAFMELEMADADGKTRKLSEWCGKGN